MKKKKLLIQQINKKVKVLLIDYCLHKDNSFYNKSDQNTYIIKTKWSN